MKRIQLFCCCSVTLEEAVDLQTRRAETRENKDGTRIIDILSSSTIGFSTGRSHQIISARRCGCHAKSDRCCSSSGENKKTHSHHPVSHSQANIALVFGLSHLIRNPEEEATYLFKFLANCFVSYATHGFPDTASIHACAVRSLASKSTLQMFVRGLCTGGRKIEEQKNRFGFKSSPREKEERKGAFREQNPRRSVCIVRERAWTKSKKRCN